MHEQSLVQALLDLIEEYAGRYGAKKICRVRLSCGRVSGIEPACLRFAFAVQSQGTVADGAHLELDLLPVRIYCFACEQEIQDEAYHAVCPRCRGSAVVLVGGTEELKLIDMDAE
ncbi:MAG: hydrogenase maturation nickel metallochaperone HypA [Desulfobacterota bacterium]|nr:hydrogenase maturation nickel metallochaperone HypA [Thermodesulfobacteriota bacterium]